LQYIAVHFVILQLYIMENLHGANPEKCFEAVFQY